ncbi:hypothetical protein K8089_02000 [Aequorivita sp. F47161]|uniref:Uncharacterized protein n=1 Tax=Aequorivita vitellina TaxID=2874475 RepID=A0A9X1QUS7_9FLAO|nr:hypothetical protein [Aequorivita vitellina]MCG2417777.1 hypothetical protein [Aequorivita vitellina]MDP2692108.1 hypothetical protein [bacterium]
MSIIPPSEIREVKGITPQQKQRIYDFLQGGIYCWCKNRSDEWFAIRDLLGGENFDWTNTPLIVLFNKHKNKGKSDDDAITDAGKDAGWIAKKVLDDDARNFETRDDFARSYRWLK